MEKVKVSPPRKVKMHTHITRTQSIKRRSTKNSIIIYGKSIGANVAIDLCSEVKAGVFISESGFTFTYDMVRILFLYLPVRWIITTKLWRFDKNKRCLYTKLVIHSKEGEIVPFNLGKNCLKTHHRQRYFAKSKVDIMRIFRNQRGIQS